MHQTLRQYQRSQRTYLERLSQVVYDWLQGQDAKTDLSKAHDLAFISELDSEQPGWSPRNELASALMTGRTAQLEDDFNRSAADQLAFGEMVRGEQSVRKFLTDMREAANALENGLLPNLTTFFGWPFMDQAILFALCESATFAPQADSVDLAIDDALRRPSAFANGLLYNALAAEIPIDYKERLLAAARTQKPIAVQDFAAALARARTGEIAPVDRNFILVDQILYFEDGEPVLANFVRVKKQLTLPPKKPQENTVRDYAGAVLVPIPVRARGRQ